MFRTGELRLAPLASVELRPLLITRIASMLPGSLLAGCGVDWWFEADGDNYRVARAVLAAFVGIVLAIRGYRLGVRYDSETLTVRGLFWSRTIQKPSIRDITVLPAVRWASQSGRTRWTPITAFAQLDTFIPSVERRNEQAIEELERWHRGR